MIVEQYVLRIKVEVQAIRLSLWFEGESLKKGNSVEVDHFFSPSEEEFFARKIGGSCGESEATESSPSFASKRSFFFMSSFFLRVFFVVSTDICWQEYAFCIFFSQRGSSEGGEILGITQFLKDIFLSVFLNFPVRGKIIQYLKRKRLNQSCGFWNLAGISAI